MEAGPEQHFKPIGAGDQMRCDRDLELLPGPLPVVEQAALEAALHEPRSSVRRYAGRAMAGAAIVAGAVAVPVLSAGAVEAPFFMLDISEPEPIVQQPIWSSGAIANAPVYAPVMAAEEIAPDAVTFSTRRRPLDDDRLAPLSFLETGSERFDLAFVGMEMPAPVAAVAIAAPLPEFKGVEVGLAAPVIRTRQIEIEQIQGLQEAPAPVQQQRTPSRSFLSAGSSVERSVAIANEAVAATFAGTLDVTRNAIPVAQDVRQPSAPLPAPSPRREEPNRIAAVPVPNGQGLSARRAEETELVPKTRLVARVNGVATGRVDFQQMEGGIAVRLGSVVDILSNRFSDEELQKLRSGKSIDAFVSLADLQAIGVPISYNPAYDEVEFGIDYNDAPDAGKVQMEQIGAPLRGTASVVIEQIPR